MDHALFEIIASFPEAVYPFCGPQSVTAIESYRDRDFHRQRSAFRMTIGNDGWDRAGSPATVIDQLLSADKYGSPLPGAVRDAIPKMIRLSLSTEMLLEPGNRVEIFSKVDKELGLPRPQGPHHQSRIGFTLAHGRPVQVSGAIPLPADCCCCAVAHMTSANAGFGVQGAGLSVVVASCRRSSSACR